MRGDVESSTRFRKVIEAADRSLYRESVEMSLQDLSLPVDVPWTLIATSRDMLATHSRPMPNAVWRSSVAVFAYDPDLSDLPEVFADRELTFLKVVCSITGFTPGHLPGAAKPDAERYKVVVDKIRERVRRDGAELRSSPPSRTPDEALAQLVQHDKVLAELVHEAQQYQTDLARYTAQLAELQRLQSMTFPCSGALLQVSIYPKTASQDPADPGTLAYFTAFEPQKRELIEVVTESGESVTQSKSNLNVRKGITGTDSTEDLDVFTGANVNVGYGGAQVGVGIQGQWGTIKKSSSDRVDITNTDASRESREGSSHTTNLSQLYHLLNSYHLGTNRALFFLQPRPHTVQQKDRFTFINGPQEIEGVQEFFLVVSRPKGKSLATDYCVDALLNTAHLPPDATLAALTEPKTYETPWFELWTGAQRPAKSNEDFWQGIAEIAGEFFFGIPFGDPGASLPLLANTFVPTEYSDAQAKLFNQPAAPSGTVPVLPVLPAIVDQTFTYKPGWRIDRTRGLGGYDLWEDPDNATWNPIGGDATSHARPQAFIDIFSTGNPDDSLTYRPDTHLRVQAFAFPKQGESDSPQTAFYHARIKVYFIRDDLPDTDRALPMFVTRRGVSTCSDSPFYDVFPEDSCSGDAPNIVVERKVHPPYVAPWNAAAAASPPVVPPSDPLQAPSPVTRKQINSSPPSGLDPTAIGSARVKMANGISREVRAQMQSAFGCGAPDSKGALSFGDTDLVFERLARASLGAEVKRLLQTTQQDPRLLHYVQRHPAASKLGVVRISSQQQGLQPLELALTHTIGATKSFPALTLGGNLHAAERELLLAAGIGSGLDLLGVSADALAERLGTTTSDARDLRMRAIGAAATAAATKQLPKAR